MPVSLRNRYRQQRLFFMFIYQVQVYFHFIYLISDWQIQYLVTRSAKTFRSKTFSQFSRVFTWLSSQNAVLGQHIYLVNNNEMFVHIKKALRLYLDYHGITYAYVLYLLFMVKPQKIVSLYTTTTILAFSSERNRPFIRKERATHISSERIRFGYLP